HHWRSLWTHLHQRLRHARYSRGETRFRPRPRTPLRSSRSLSHRRYRSAAGRSDYGRDGDTPLSWRTPGSADSDPDSDLDVKGNAAYSGERRRHGRPHEPWDADDEPRFEPGANHRAAE